MNDERAYGPEEPPLACGGDCAHHTHSLALSEDIFCLTGEPHVWADWERVVEIWDESTMRSPTMAQKRVVPTGDRARECKVCGRWEIEWAES